jgi:hypothetical protein
LRSAAASILVGLACVVAVPSASAAEPVPAVAKASAERGWPHLVTKPEMLAITKRALRTYTPRGQRGWAECRWPRGTVGLTLCRGRNEDFNWSARLRFVEDGSYDRTTITIIER